MEAASAVAGAAVRAGAETMAPVAKAALKGAEIGANTLPPIGPEHQGATSFLKNIKKGEIFNGLKQFAQPDRKFTANNEGKKGLKNVVGKMQNEGIKTPLTTDAKEVKPLTAEEQMGLLRQEVSSLKLQNKDLRTELDKVRRDTSAAVTNIEALKNLTREQKNQVIGTITTVSEVKYAQQEANAKQRQADVLNALKSRPG